MMKETEIIQLRKKIEELKTNYEKAKEQRIKIVNTMEALDKKITEYENIKTEMAQNHKKYIMNKELITKGIKKTLAITTFGTIVFMISNIISNNFSMFLSQILFLLTINGIIHILPPVLIKIKKPKIRRVTIKEITKLEDEYKQLIEERISKGQEYKTAREEEVIAEKIYKVLEPILSAEITRIYLGIEKDSTIPDIDIKDIYYKIKVDPSFDSETIENKKIILDELFRKYLSSKIAKIYYNSIRSEDLAILSAEELVKILMNHIPTSKHNEILQQLIHAVINFSSNLQGYGIIWYEENEQSLIHNPAIVFDEQDKWTDLKTHKNTNYQTLFSKVYDTFLNEVMKKSTPKSKIKQ